MRYPRVSDFKNEVDADGRKVCRNCTSVVPTNRRNYCSDKCMLEFNRNHDWYWIRKDVLKRDNYRCSICSKRFKKSQLDVDHIIPLQMGGQPFDKRNLRTLCQSCHKEKSKLDRDALSGLD